jgi:hypothetical protein
VQRAEVSAKILPELDVKSAQTASLFGRLSLAKSIIATASDALACPDWGHANRGRELQRICALSPLWSGCLETRANLAATRGYSIIGPQSLVEESQLLLNNARVFEAADVRGWRNFVYALVHSFDIFDIGSIIRIGRETEVGPAVSLELIDSKIVTLNQDENSEFPRHTYPIKILNKTYWAYDRRVGAASTADYERIVNNPSTDINFAGLGISSSSVALELIKLSAGVFLHYIHEVSNAPTEYIVTNLSQEEFDSVNQLGAQQVSETFRKLYEDGRVPDSKINKELEDFLGEALIFFSDGS